MAEKHLIIGGSGFIGRHVALLLARLGHHVTLTARAPLAYRFPADVEGSIIWKSIEIASADWDTLVAGATVVHHYAWTSIPASANSNPAADLAANVSATLGLLDALVRRGNGRVVFSSSGGTVYGNARQTPVPEEHQIAPVTAYGAGKATAEIYFSLYRKLHGIDCRIARIANPYGAGQNMARGLGAVTVFLSKALRGEPITIWGDGEVIRDYIHVSDVATCLVALATAPRNSNEFIFNVGSGIGFSLNEIVAELQTCLRRNIDVCYTPGRAFDVPINVLAIDRAQQILGWSPRISFSEGICRTLSDLSPGSNFSTLD